MGDGVLYVIVTTIRRIISSSTIIILYILKLCVENIYIIFLSIVVLIVGKLYTTMGVVISGKASIVYALMHLGALCLLLGVRERK